MVGMKLLQQRLDDVGRFVDLVQVVHGDRDLAQLDHFALAAAGARGDHQVADAPTQRGQRDVDVEVVVLRRQAAADAARGRLRSRSGR